MVVGKFKKANDVVESGVGNSKNRPHLEVSRNRLLNIISIVFFIVWFLALNIFSLSDFGISM